jgi:selenocysteine lyase/cysteine desulfurase
VIVDGSQIVGKRAVDVDILWCDVFIATAHKMYAQSWLGMLYIRKDLMNQLKSPRGWWAMIEDVTSLWYTAKSNREGREPWTPNIVGAVSLWAAIQYLNKQWMTSLQQHDDELISYFLEKFNHLLTGKYTLHWKKSAEQRIGIFSLTPKDTTINMVLLWEKLGLQGIAVRTWGHCTHPYRHSQWLHGSIRMSTACYTEKKDIDVCINELMKQTTVGSS